ncbi:MAG TPA: [protein-PII] uridylyltransferase [Nitrosospira sp.]|nr:[protein-PII] uridylyltransferase [Nitrosospira sp.]
MSREALNTEAIKSTLSGGRESLRRRYQETGNGAALLRSHCRLVDGILRKVWQGMAMHPSLALLAVGGYGRQQLFPYSDIDLLVLLPPPEQGRAEPEDAIACRLERWVSLLWDIGLEVGHSVRSLDQCAEEAAKDITVQTSLLEARQLAGNKILFQEFSRNLTAGLDSGAFFDAKLFEQAQRHERYHDATYNLEPNIKESPGGLRDLQNVLWVSRAAGLGKSWPELAHYGLITPPEVRLAVRQHAILRDLRIRLHYLAGRREDRLLFDYQTPLAEELHIKAKKPRRSGEVLMQRYYRAAKSVSQLNTILMLSLRGRIFPDRENAPVIVNERFQERNELLEARDEKLFEKDASAILESMLLLQQHPEIKAHSAGTLRALWRAAPLINKSFRHNPRNRELFMQILRQPRGLTRGLRLMNRCGILGRYIPAFGRIVGQMQHDLFHVYTVDEHILMVVRNLRRFMSAEYSHEYPLCSRLISEFNRPEVLYLAALFHDIAKGRNGDHSILGRKDAQTFCESHGLPFEDTELVIWLVENHLLMSLTAQKKDFSDIRVIADFAGRMKNERRLVALYLLTVADIRGTSPRVWNGWKGKLLEDLFRATRSYLSGGSIHFDEGAASRKGKVLELLGIAGIPPGAYEQFLSALDPDYLLLHDPQEIAWHASHLHRHMKSPVPIVKARLAPASAGIQVLVYTADQKDLFARICGFFDRTGYNIAQAQIHTSRHGYALDSFLILDPINPDEEHREAIRAIEHDLVQQLKHQAPLQPPLQGRLSRHLKHFPIKPEIDIELDERGAYHILSVLAGDQPGLLSRIAQVLAEFTISVHSARINTLGERAEDTFLIAGNVLNDTRSLVHLETRLLKALQLNQKPSMKP